MKYTYFNDVDRIVICNLSNRFLPKKANKVYKALFKTEVTKGFTGREKGKHKRQYKKQAVLSVQPSK